MNTAEHPLTGLYDAIASAGRATDAEIEETVARCAGSTIEPGEIPADELRRQVRATARRIIAAAKDGNAGEARNIGREHVAAVAERLPEPAPIDRNAGKTTAEIIASIPRRAF
ncbi:MAG: hypothetical protein AB7Q42_12930 [Acidimicrobiia bacterium]